MIDKQYYVVLCKFCGKPRVARSWQKTFYCYSCHKQVKLEGCKILFKTDKVKDAIYFVQNIKKK
jgi:ribosomal protein L37AE/L43A